MTCLDVSRDCPAWREIEMGDTRSYKYRVSQMTMPISKTIRNILSYSLCIGLYMPPDDDNMFLYDSYGYNLMLCICVEGAL